VRPSQEAASIAVRVNAGQHGNGCQCFTVLNVCGIHLTMSHFLLIPDHQAITHPPAGFALLEGFRCPNCGRTVFIASTRREKSREGIERARNAVTLHCPGHDLPACVETRAEDKRRNASA
jgi:hypothetical protein